MAEGVSPDSENIDHSLTESPGSSSSAGNTGNINLPAKAMSERESQSKVFLSTQTTMSYSGPVPPARELAEYDKISPGFAERIFLLAEGEALHRRQMEESILDAQIFEIKQEGSEIRRGQICALVIAVVLAVIGLVAALYNHEITGGIIGVGGVGGIVSTFILGRSKPISERPTPPPTSKNRKPKSKKR